MDYFACFLIGVITGLITGEYLPPETVNHFMNEIKMKVKKSVINDSELTNTQQTHLPFADPQHPINQSIPKKKGIFKRIFSRKKRIKSDTK